MSTRPPLLDIDRALAEGPPVLVSTTSGGEHLGWVRRASRRYVWLDTPDAPLRLPRRTVTAVHYASTPAHPDTHGHTPTPAAQGTWQVYSLPLPAWTYRMLITWGPRPGGRVLIQGADHDQDATAAALDQGLPPLQAHHIGHLARLRADLAEGTWTPTRGERAYAAHLRTLIGRLVRCGHFAEFVALFGEHHRQGRSPGTGRMDMVHHCLRHAETGPAHTAQVVQELRALADAVGAHEREPVGARR